MGLLYIVSKLAEAGISTTIRSTGHGLIAEFEDGFYKSDGMAYLSTEDGRLHLNARYGEKTEVLIVDDVIRCSKEWHEFSKDRFDGWRTPPAHWAALYAVLVPNAK